MRSAEFGPDSTNPRMRRAYAHAKLAQFRSGEGTFKSAREAVNAAIHTNKGGESGFEAALFHAARRKFPQNAVLLVDWTGGHFDRPAFGGYIMSPQDGTYWEERHDNAVNRAQYAGYNAIFDAGYPMATLLTTEDNKDNFRWGTQYPLAQNPARATIVDFSNS